MNGGRALVIGDALLDICIPPAETADYRYHSADRVFDMDRRSVELGGAGRTALWLAEHGMEVDWLCLQHDEAVLQLLRESGVSSRIDLLHHGEARRSVPHRIWLQASGTALRLDDNNSSSGGTVRPVALSPAADYSVVIVNDYAQGSASLPSQEWLGSARQKLVWDPHERGMRPPAGTLLAVPNIREASTFCAKESGFASEPPIKLHEVARVARHLKELWQVSNLSITVDARGAISDMAGAGLQWTPAPRVWRSGNEATTAGASARGAGDVYTAAIGSAWASGLVMRDAVLSAVEASTAFVDRAMQPGSSGPTDLARDALHFALQARSRGATVVAVGGVFDVLHAGHVYLLNSAAALGDVLIVIANDDGSVQRLKGDGRPVFSFQERVANLMALGVVDAVMPFAEDTPIEALRILRPDVFIKGDDYSTETIPERTALQEMGSIALTVPFRENLSSTQLLERIGKIIDV